MDHQRPILLSEIISTFETANLNDLQPEYVIDGSNYKHTTTTGLTITVKTGYLENETVDVIVNTTSPNLDLRATGGVSRAIVQQAGTCIIDECARNAPHGAKAGQIVATTGGNLNVQYIFHGFCGSWDGILGQNGVKNLSIFIQNALEEAKDFDLSSIAFPAIGTGQNGFPVITVAKVMAKEIMNFGKRNAYGVLSDIRIVLYPNNKSVIQAFDQHFIMSIQNDGGQRLHHGLRNPFSTVQNDGGQRLHRGLRNPFSTEITTHGYQHPIQGQFDQNIKPHQAVGEHSAVSTEHAGGQAHNHSLFQPLYKAGTTTIDQIQDKYALPHSWIPMSMTVKVKLVELLPNEISYNTDEYLSVFSPFFDSIGQVKRIQRVQNPELHELYQLKKTQISRTINPNEQILYHGTDYNSLQNINSGGFNRSYCGKNATSYGNGVYFATNPSYSASHTYSPPDANGNRYIYQCRVLVGKYTKGQKGLREPPLKDPVTKDRYDSVADNPFNPRMIVIFQDAQAYPEYLITF